MPKAWDAWASHSLLLCVVDSYSTVLSFSFRTCASPILSKFTGLFLCYLEQIACWSYIDRVDISKSTKVVIYGRPDSWPKSETVQHIQACQWRITQRHLTRNVLRSYTEQSSWALPT